MTRKKDCLKGQKILKAKLKTKMKKNQNQSDKLDYIFKNFDTNFKNAGKNVLKKLAKDEKKFDYNNLLFKIEDKSVPKDVDFLKEFGTLYDLLIYLLNNSIRMTTSAKD